MVRFFAALRMTSVEVGGASEDHPAVQGANNPAMGGGVNRK